MAFLAGANNAVLINNCQNLSNVTVQVQVTEDLITLEDTGFSVQMNCYPQIGAITPNSTQGTTFPGGGRGPARVVSICPDHNEQQRQL